MTNNIYSLYNVLSCRYTDVMAFPSDAFAVRRVCDVIQATNRKEWELCRVGNIDIDTGVMVPCAPIRIALPDDSAVPSMPVAPTVTVNQ